MDANFLISKIMYNLYNNPFYPIFIKIIDFNKTKDIFKYSYFYNNIEYNNNYINIDDLFKIFNVLKPEFSISLKEIKDLNNINSKKILIINRYRGEDELLYKEYGLEIDLDNIRNTDCNYFIREILYVYLDSDNTIKYKNSKTIKTIYGYYNSDIKKILIDDFNINIEKINYIYNFICDFLAKIIGLMNIENEQLFYNIISLNEYGLNFLIHILNKIIDINTIRFFTYSYTINIRFLLHNYKEYNLLLLKHNNIIIIMIFKEKPTYLRTQEESGFSQEEISIFLSKK